ncbi:thioesterase [Mycobacterium sp. 20KCMC460]|uniref:Acyl-coenzyme A thioesterase THEM4 n=2 Tax=Mycobacterium kiyosense TaxID=2871094 RepID=A0A9P3Q7D2_9MYCO|nr:thioesterase [Mycobacterium kiyosense]BDE14892.1 thioesterase [Mycobacterium sp. 20KCMC460]GLB95969.1 thioesterase [Mycobacterium kiyosense]GLC01538.1 thioesterase [Mycobacterium kiyosense]GLD30022.1 thioesterase [Mycobacterium kiyosense]
MVTDMVDSFASMTDSLPVYESLAVSVRRLIDATIRTEVSHDVIAAARAKIDSVTSELSAELMPGTFGERRVQDGQGVASGNVVIGVRNPSAPPLVVHYESDGSAWTEFTLGAAFEGPMGHVHGGVSAMILDHVLGATAHQPGRPAYTGTLTLRYHRRTPLRQPLRAEAWVESRQGVKTFAAGQISDAEGVTVSAEGIFIHPRDS